MADDGDDQLNRRGETWTVLEYEQLLRGVVAGLPVEQIAADLHRTPAGVNAQITRLVPDGEPVPRGSRARREWLSQRAADPSYDWRAVLNSRPDGIGRLWLDEEDDRLRQAWQNRLPLPELAAVMHLSEPVIVRRLMTLGLAEHVAAVVDRLGATPGGTIAARARLLRGELAEAIYVLTIEDPYRPKVSLHHSRQEAEAALRRTIDGAPDGEIRWSVRRRTLDGRDAGQNWTGPLRGRPRSG